MSKTNKIQYNEKYPIDKVEAIIGCKREIIYEVFGLDSGGKQDHIIKQLTQLYKSAPRKDGNLIHKVTYTSKKSNPMGRMYAKGLSYQSMPKTMRSFLAQNMVEYDQQCSRLSLMAEFAHTCNILIPNIDHYLLLKANGDDHYDALITKHDLNAALNQDQVHNKHHILETIHSEIMLIHHSIVNGLHKEDFKNYNGPPAPLNTICKKQKQSNKISHKSQWILEQKEVQIMTAMFKDFTPDDGLSYIHDAVLVDPKDEDKLIRDHSHAYIKYNRTVLSTDIEIDDLLPDESYFHMKREFEKNYFHILNIARFGQMSDEYNLETLNLSEFEINHAHLTCTDPASGKEVAFVNVWRRDPIHKTYERPVFKPFTIKQPLEDTDDKNLNTFTGYKIPYEEDGIEDASWYVKFLEDALGAHAEYVLNYQAHIIQYPRKNQEIVIVLRGDEGTGKDTIIDVFTKFLGTELVGRTSDCEHIFGTFNPIMKGRLIVQINEANCKDMAKNKERIKDQVTAGTIVINEKNKPQYSIDNCCNIIITSNNENPIQAGQARRFVMIDMNPFLAGDHEYWTALRKNINDPIKMQQLMNYMMRLDVSKFNASQEKPITDTLTEVMQNQACPSCKYWAEAHQDGYDDWFDKAGKVYKVQSDVVHDIKSIIEADLNRNASAKEVMQWFNLEKGAIKTGHSVKIAGQVVKCIVIDKTRFPYLEKKYKHMFVTNEIDAGLTQNPLDDDDNDGGKKKKKYKHMFVTNEIDAGLTQNIDDDDDDGGCINDLDK
jgi:hypothetical protein